MGYWVTVDVDTASGKPSDEVTLDAGGGRLAEAGLWERINFPEGVPED